MSKTWFVTGANSGIGEGIVKAALAAGANVVATARNLEKLHAAFPEKNDALALVALDVTNGDQATAAIAAAVERFGTVDVVVNNAGFCILGNFEDLSAEDFERQLATNFYGPVNVLHAALPVLRKQRSGHIINISSAAGGIGMAQCAAYSASKFALEGLSQAVASEVEQFGIHVTVVEPGFFRTCFLNEANYDVVETEIADYAKDGSARDSYAAYNGQQPGNPLKLGEALVEINAMETPLKLFLAGSDCVATLQPVVEARLATIKAEADRSATTDGGF